MPGWATFWNRWSSGTPAVGFRRGEGGRWHAKWLRLCPKDAKWLRLHLKGSPSHNRVEGRPGVDGQRAATVGELPAGG
ncbi:hypothetical protein [Streptomyces cellulosae]|uniref:hypothetical protein n=1 Tax=Streptomyces cellulosae TaxID=1968 RepID=UPI0004C5AFE3|nr:hypothetical protein [Streptomyces cellulosae]